MGYQGIFLIVIEFLLLSNFTSQKLKKTNKDEQSSTKTILTPEQTIHYTFQIKADHLIFVKVVKDQYYRQVLRLDYYQVKSLMTRRSQTHLKSLNYKSLQDLMESRRIKKLFCIPLDMKEGKKINDFLREIMLLNKAK